MNKKTKLRGLALAALMAVPQLTLAQQTVTIDPLSPPVSYAARQPKVAAAQPQQDALAATARTRRHRQGGTYTAPGGLKDARTATLNNLLLRDKPVRITAEQVRRAAKKQLKAPFKPDNDHRYLIVNVCYNSLDETEESGLFALDVETGELTGLVYGFADYENYGFNGGAYVWNGKYRGVFYEQGTTVTRSNPARVMDFDMETWEMDEETFVNTTIPYHTSMAIECATEYHADGTTSVLGQFWGTDAEGNLSLRYATLDDNGLTTTRMGEMGAAQKYMLAMGVTSDGRLYGVAKDGNLYQVDRTTGAERLVGHTGIDDLVDYEGHIWLQGGEIDPRDNTFYWVADHATSERSLLCSVDLATGQATVLVDFGGDVECAGIVIAPQQRQNATPAAVTDLTVSFGRLQTTGSGSFTAPTTSFDGQPLAAGTPLYYHIFVNGVEQTAASNQTTPGTTVNFNIASANVKNNAENTISVTTSLTADGEQSLSARATQWVGYGIAQAPQNAAMTLDEATGTCTISWEHPATGDNAGAKGGVVETVSYFVYRVIDGDRDATDIHGGMPLMDDQTSITYTLSEAEQTASLGDLSFAVVAVTSQWGFPLTALTSEPAMTNSVSVGQGKAVPYFVDFANDYYNVRQKDFTIIDGNQDGKTWKFIEPHVSVGQELSGAVATNNYSTTSQNDEWFITPGIALEAGKSYHFKSNMHGPSTVWYEFIEVRIGTDKTPESMTQTIISRSMVEDYCVKEGDFTVPADGNYYIGLHAVSDPNQWEIALFDISVTDNEGSLEDQVSPTAVELAVSPVYGITTLGDGTVCGTADIQLTLPTQQRNGSSLNGRQLTVALTATLDGTTQTLQEWTGQAPGTTLQYSTEALPSGNYTFGVTAAYLGDDGLMRRSPLTAVTGYVGWDDKPAVPTDAKVVQSGDKLLVRFSPESPLKGANGAYLPSLSYRAYTGSKAGQIAYYGETNPYVYEAIAPDAQTDGTELQIPDFNPSEGMQYNFKYYIMAVSKDAQGNNIYSDFQPINAIIGQPSPAPVMETGDRTFLLDGSLSPELEEVWTYWLNRGQQVAGIEPIEDQFGRESGKSWYVYSAFNGELTALFGKVDISSLQTPRLEFDVILEDTDTDMEVILNGPDGLQAVHKVSVMDGVQHISIPLAQYQSWGWVQPSLKSIFHLTVDGDHYHDVFFDNVGVYDALPQNLAIQSFDIPVQLNSGEETMANVSVMNIGQQAVGNYTVTLTEDDVPVQSQTISRTLQPGDVRVVQFRYRANTVNAHDRQGMDDAEKVLVATLQSEGDGNEADNTAEAVVTITVQGGKHNSYPSDAAARQQEGSTAVDVSWTFDTERTSQQVTESFEDYPLWFTGGVASGAPEGQIGPWHLYDGDGKPTYTWQNFEVITPYAGEPQAYQVFDGSIFGGMNEYYYYDMDAVTGNQYLVSMDPADGNYTPRPDDWLISPEVRGGTTLEFYYGSLLRNPQGCEVYYSETGRDVSDFQLLKSLDQATGTDWYLGYVTLPETARYFAIRHSSASYMGYGLKIDDITYSRITTVDHFNIYVDGQLTATSDQTSCTLTDQLTEGQHRIAVTAVFSDGTESVPAYATLDYTPTAIRELLASGKPFDVYTVDGKRVRQQTRTLDGLKGVYVVNDQKVVVK